MQRCSVFGCLRQASRARSGMCFPHWHRVELFGSPLAGLEPAACEWCGDEFVPTMLTRCRFCSSECRYRWWAAERREERKGRCRLWSGPCGWCGRALVGDARGPRVRFCSTDCRIESSVQDGPKFLPPPRDPALASSTGKRRPKRQRQPVVQPVAPEADPVTVGLIVDVVPFTRSDVADRDGWTCQECGGRVDGRIEFPDPRSIALRHVVPLDAGGVHELTNCELVHLSCFAVGSGT